MVESLTSEGGITDVGADDNSVTPAITIIDPYAGITAMRSKVASRIRTGNLLPSFVLSISYRLIRYLT